MLVQQTAADGQSVALVQSTDTVLQLQHALQQIDNIGTALTDIQRYYQHQVWEHVMKEGVRENKNKRLVLSIVTCVCLR